jgi:hypothetical protein
MPVIIILHLLSKIRLGYIWHDVSVNTVSGICKKLKKDVMI